MWVIVTYHSNKPRERREGMIYRATKIGKNHFTKEMVPLGSTGVETTILRRSRNKVLESKPEIEETLCSY
jgi:hypothetical protein